MTVFDELVVMLQRMVRSFIDIVNRLLSAFGMDNINLDSAED